MYSVHIQHCGNVTMYYIYCMPSLLSYSQTPE